jgi:transcription termination factor Rho
MIEDLNPVLYDKLLLDDELDEYVTDSARWMADQYESQTRDASPMRKATVREVVIAQMREEIEADPNPPADEDDPEGISLSDLEEIIGMVGP